MRRLFPLALSLLLVVACDDQVGPPGDLGPDGPLGAILDADSEDPPNPHVRWLPPIVKDVQEENFGTFDPGVLSAKLHVVCYATSDGLEDSNGHPCSQADEHWQDPANEILIYTTDGSGDGPLLIQEPDEQYHAQVDLAGLDVSEGEVWTTYRLVVTVEALENRVWVAAADFRVLPNGRAKSALEPEEEIGLIGSTLPVKFRLDEGVIAAAAEDVLAGDPDNLPEPIQDAISSFGDGPFTVTVVRQGESTTVEFEGETDRTTAAFHFDPEDLVEDIVFFLGKPADGGDDTCGDAFDFETAGCHRALAYSLSDPEPAPSDITSGYEFAGDVDFCIATDIADTDHRPWQLIKIDDYTDGPVFVVLDIVTGGVCDFVDEPPPPPVIGIADWLRQNIGRRILDLVAPPLYASHSPSKMGSSIKDLSDLTAAILEELTGALQDPSGDSNVSGGADFATASAVVGGNLATLATTFYDFDPATSRVIWTLDMDQDPNTGFSGIDSGNNDSERMGLEYQVVIQGSDFDSLVLIESFSNGSWTTTTTSIEPTLLDGGYQVTVPLSLLGDDDGEFNFKAIVQEQQTSSSFSGIQDYISDVGLDPGTTSPFIVE